MSLESIERELTWRKDQFDHLQSKIPVEAFVLYAQSSLTDGERLTVETFRPMIQTYHRIQTEIELLEQESYICSLEESIQELTKLIDLVEEDIIRIRERFTDPWQNVAKKRKQVKAWRKERLGYEKELVILKQKQRFTGEPCND